MTPVAISQRQLLTFDRSVWIPEARAILIGMVKVALRAEAVREKVAQAARSGRRSLPPAWTLATAKCVGLRGRMPMKSRFSGLRRAGLLALLGPLILACSSPERRATSSQDQGPESGSSSGMMGGGMPMMRDGMMGGGMMGASMDEMRVIRGLLASPDRIERIVQDVPNGVLAVTTSDDPGVARLIRTHVRQMRASYDRDEPIRPMDPVFRELFANRDRITLEVEDIPGGVRVLHRSDDARVAALIRQHAHRFVSEAAEQGMARAMRPTPLPEGYERPGS